MPARDPAQIDVADIRTALRVIPSSKLKLDLQSVPGVVQLQSEIDALIGARLKLGSLADLMNGVTRPRSSSH